MFGLEKYNYTADKTFRVYSFMSSGPNGSIQKIAKFNEIGSNIYNFGFGDYDPETGDISDTSVSNNQDTDTIMGTVGSIIYDFTNVFMDALIFIQGTNAARTRLYQININKHWTRIEPVLEVFGLKNERWEPFKKAINYTTIQVSLIFSQIKYLCISWQEDQKRNHNPKPVLNN